MQCRQLLGLLRKFRAHSQQGLPPNGLLTLYKGLIKSKFLYSLPLANIRGPQRDQLERFHKVALRLCLGLPSNSPNIPTLVEAREQPLFFKGEESSKMHLIRIHVALSTDYLLMNLHLRSSSHFGRIAAEFTNEIGDPGPRFPIRPPHSTQPPLNVQRSLPDVRARKDLHPVVARTAVAVALEEKPIHSARQSPIPVPDSRLTRADASLLHRLRTGSAFTRLALHRYGRAGRVDSPECTVCGDPKDITHILLICPEYDAARKVLFATVLKAGGQTATTACLLFPTGSRRQAWSIFRAVPEFLHQTELAERL
ncbi:hypothetical protein HPB47_000267 [Ixodes persulcatus]|uniref:Uncharacterized protein n=1 Tax=Ixodes persulcatus TaxID=34615 RepID=A0AC60PS77_IXOPE|nr:hypothetical protein HPB47_000267 [Ixodes persulcatus]